MIPQKFGEPGIDFFQIVGGGVLRAVQCTISISHVVDMNYVKDAFVNLNTNPTLTTKIYNVEICFVVPNEILSQFRLDLSELQEEGLMKTMRVAYSKQVYGLEEKKL